jgi:hypothetical protein
MHKMKKQRINNNFLPMVPPLPLSMEMPQQPALSWRNLGICVFNKKIPDRVHDPGFPFFIRRISPGNNVAGAVKPLMFIQTGLLTCGSIYSLRLPVHKNSGSSAAFVPVYSRGPVPDSHRVPS